jgi:hypothetical protein
MQYHNHLNRYLLMAIGFIVFLSSCVSFRQSAENLNTTGKPKMRITIIEAYQGIKDGNVESVRLPAGRAFITIKMCVENLSTVPETVYWQDIFLDLGDNIRIYPVALGYDQAEAFSWVLPIAAPIGAKSIDHKFYFFLIQKAELIRVPAYQSLGCDNSAQFKSLALLFMVKKESAGNPYILRFLGAPMPFTAKKISSFSMSVAWGVGLGLFIVIAVAALVLRKKRLQVQVSLSPENNQNGSQGEL